MKREDLRKVEYKNKNGENTQGYFHQWIAYTYGENGKIIAGVSAIVELEGGNVVAVPAIDIKFVNKIGIDDMF